MIRMLRSSALCALLLATAAQGQMPGGFDPKEASERFANWVAAAPSGSGPHPSVRTVAPGLATHTLYWPASRPARMGRLPIVAFGNGGCRNTSIEFAAFLAEIASRGYFVIAVGTDDVPYMGGSKGGKPQSRIEASALTEAVDWAITENGRRGSAFHKRLDTARIAYMGQSCGGVQALSASVDPRTSTTVVLNSGYFGKQPDPKAAATAPAGGIRMAERQPWNKFSKPIAFLVGGPADVAFKNAEANFAEASDVPMFKASLPVGHTGAYPKPDMRWTLAVVNWLDWQLKGKREAASMFVGASCGLCRDPEWSNVASHGLR
jgi:dienelactone hydrolase